MKENNNKREEFIKTFAYQVNGIKYKKEFSEQVNQIKIKKFEEETAEMQPTMGEIADGYRSFISDLGEGFLQIVENYNDALEIAKEANIIGDVRLKARIKDFSSSRINTDIKILDDVFGMEIVTSPIKEDGVTTDYQEQLAEKDKELLMLFNHFVFDISKDKKYNKPTGYTAYHCMGDLNIEANKINNIEDWIKTKVNETETREYKRSKSEPTYGDKKHMVDVFPNLIKLIENPEELSKISRTFVEMAKYINVIDEKLQLPIIEFHFLTGAAEKEALTGKASHSKYKATNEKLIKSKLQNGELIRGINSPWKFVGTPNGLKVQDFYDTLSENWPFLVETINERRIAGKEEKDKRISSKFDYLSAYQFPFLRKYIEPHKYYENKKEEMWGVLKTSMIVNRIDETKPLADELVAQLLEL